MSKFVKVVGLMLFTTIKNEKLYQKVDRETGNSNIIRFDF
jgi:hypothetical protein